ncbi:MAG: ATP-binding protein [Synechococcaceae cyanobacterium]|jgi:serine/threonine-protein kinase RsbW/non-specific serine/threonine protein kinase
MAARWADYITPSTLQLAPLLELLLEPVGTAPRLSELQLGLQEALVNAVRHGNGCDPAKCLRVRRIVTPRWLVWQIQDEGPGLPPQARVRHLPQEPAAHSGRGLFLIHHCFDDVRWSPRGNRLQLAARRPRPPAGLIWISAGLRPSDGDSLDR